MWTSLRAIPQLRRTPESSGLEERQRAAPGDKTGLIPSYARITKLLGRTDVALYQKPNLEPELYALACFPPCIVARTRLVPDATVVFRLAQLLVYCEPAHAVTCLLAETEGRDLLAALLGAFGPPSREHSRTGKDYGAALLLCRCACRTLRELVRISFVLDSPLAGRQCSARAQACWSRSTRSATRSDRVSHPHTSLAHQRDRGATELTRATRLIRGAFSETTRLNGYARRLTKSARGGQVSRSDRPSSPAFCAHWSP